MLELPELSAPVLGLLLSSKPGASFGAGGVRPDLFPAAAVAPAAPDPIPVVPVAFPGPPGVEVVASREAPALLPPVPLLSAKASWLDNASAAADAIKANFVEDVLP
ncbi:hypothetical protein [Bradyrhizobium sp. SZCCHNRI1029]|uniref:hypothetical protein n=1 Tax=Bradyrhizobium sp. SZCCHNRI1029 TaxID=3057278 RepID=UPI002915F77D|nr:hypothetical protein [Bradyrhizobium sp. SZCCHNRI1029]